MSDKLLIVPFFSPAHAPFLEAALRSAGADVVVKASCGEKVVHEGLSTVNNDACFSAIMAAGQARCAVAAAKGAPCEVVVPAPCVRCRADDLEFLVKRSLGIRETGPAGSTDAATSAVRDVAALLTETDDGGSVASEQLQRRIAWALMVGDVVLQVETRLRPALSAKDHTSFEALLTFWRQHATRHLAGEAPFDVVAFSADFERACAPFAAERTVEARPAVGIIGSAPAVFCTGINADLVAGIEREGCEAVVPYLSSMVEYSLMAKGIACPLADELSYLCARFAPGSNLLRPCPTLDNLKRAAAAVMPLGITQGAGWLLAGTLRLFWDQGVESMVYASVFGCLAGHVVGQGVMKRLRELCPGINLATVEYDPGTSPVNQANRIKLLTAVAKRTCPAPE